MKEKLCSKKKKWEEKYNELLTFIDDNNRLPKHSEFYWLTDQKTYFKKGILDNHKIILLKQIDRNIFKPKRIIKTWEENYNELKNFVQSKGRFPVRKESYWLSNQISFFKKGKLSNKQIKLLRQLDNDIFKPKFKKWCENYEDLQKFICRYDRLPIDREFRWLAYQKQSYKKGKLPNEKIILLMKIDYLYFRKIMFF